MECDFFRKEILGYLVAKPLCDGSSEFYIIITEMDMDANSGF